jgi:ABC-type arginine transport system permease subunit
MVSRIRLFSKTFPYSLLYYSIMKKLNSIHFAAETYFVSNIKIKRFLAGIINIHVQYLAFIYARY